MLGLPRFPVAVAHLTLGALVVGTGLFLLPPFGAMPLGYQMVLAGGLVTLWCFVEGPFGRLRLVPALVEAAAMLGLALDWTDFLVSRYGTTGIG